jgi:hypothetical protein
MDERARDPSMGVAEERCDEVAATFFPCAFGLEIEVVLLSSRLRNWVLFMFAKPAKCRELRRDDNRDVLVYETQKSWIMTEDLPQRRRR